MSRGKKQTPLTNRTRQARTDLPSYVIPVFDEATAPSNEELLKAFKHINKELKKKRPIERILIDFRYNTNGDPYEEWANRQIRRLKKGETIQFDPDFFPPLVDTIFQGGFKAGKELKDMLPEMIKLVQRTIDSKQRLMGNESG